jgi:hypothetical protein
VTTPAIRDTLERLLQHIDDPSYTAFAHGCTIAALRAFMATIDDLLTAVSAAYSAHGWVANEEFIRLFEDVVRLAGIVEDGWDASASPDDTKAKTHTALAARPLLERVAAMADRIGRHTVNEIVAVSASAAEWLRENPPGQPVAIEPRGCPMPGACSCVVPVAPPAPKVRSDPTPADRLAQAVCRGACPIGGPCPVEAICRDCRRDSAAVAHELAAILRERYGSSATADWLDGVGCHAPGAGPTVQEGS